LPYKSCEYGRDKKHHRERIEKEQNQAIIVERCRGGDRSLGPYSASRFPASAVDNPVPGTASLRREIVVVDMKWLYQSLTLGIACRFMEVAQLTCQSPGNHSRPRIVISATEVDPGSDAQLGL